MRVIIRTIELIFLWWIIWIGGWASPNDLLLQSDESPLPTGKISVEESAWISSMLAISGLFGPVLFGLIANKFGRKAPLMALTVPITLSWLLIAFAQVCYLHIVRLFQGIISVAIFSCRTYTFCMWEGSYRALSFLELFRYASFISLRYPMTGDNNLRRWNSFSYES